MLRYLAPLFCSVLLLAGWSATEANAQAARAQAHVAAASAAAYEPGQDFTAIFALCAAPNPNPPAAAAAPAAAPSAAAEPTIPPRSQWVQGATEGLRQCVPCRWCQQRGYLGSDFIRGNYRDQFGL